MGLFSFVKNAGASLLGFKTDAQKREEAVAKKQAVIKEFVAKFGLGIEDLSISFAGEDDDTAILDGFAKTQADKEKLILAVGNIEGIATVDDRIKVQLVEKPEPQSVFYTVVKGDSLSKIAKAQYGNAMKYPVIFEANKPMLTDPDKIYPGQVLRIPPLEA
ncbi:MAG: peptidoglycan-binding protein LysM [Bacteroidia bacterium]|nr:peptidoglycan-binding protein LysM [Bacteroidia bacterium]